MVDYNEQIKNCVTDREIISYLSGRIDSKRKKEIDHHKKKCEICEFLLGPKLQKEYELTKENKALLIERINKSLKCDNIRDIYLRWCDDALTQKDKKHLGECEYCKEFIGESDRMRESVRKAMPPIPIDLEEKISLAIKKYKKEAL